MMGLFDYIRCKMPLPAEPRAPACEWFQTKDTAAQYMERYTITTDGRLIHHSVRYEETPKEERRYPDAEPDSPLSFLGSIRSIPTGDVDVPVSGAIEFHHFNKATEEWWGYTALFDKGHCINLICSEYRADPQSAA